MAGRAHVDVSERRLRPIYDNLDNGNNKMAIQLADKVLKKQKDLHCAKVLKALALFRMGKQAKASDVLDEVATLEPTDDPTLQAMSICYREMQKPDLVTKLFETALKKHPTNEEFHSHLFMSYVRMSDYKKQQQAAMALYRQYPKNPYYFWAVMSIVMQAIFSSDEDLSKKMFLPLALKMVEKLVKEDKIEAEAEVQLYLMILDLMQNYEESLKVLKSKLGEKIVTEYNYHKYSIACLLAKLEKWPETNSAYRKLIQEEPDQWTFYVAYFKSAFALIDSNWTSPEQGASGDAVPEESPPDHTVDSVMQFIDDIYKTELEKEGKHQRGPFLARMELYKEMKKRDKPEIEKLESLDVMLNEYFEIFGDKYCCFSDVAPYLNYLGEDQAETFVRGVWDSLELEPRDGEITLASNDKQMQRHLCYLQCSRYLGLHAKLSSSEKISLSKELLVRHKDGMQFGAALLSTDLQPCDMYCLLAAHLLLDIWQETEDSNIIWKAVAALEYGISKSPSNHHFKLLLIRVYCLLGAFGPCPELYDGMEIKHIQQDTLGYTVTRFCDPLGHFVSAAAVYNATLKFFTVNNKDTTEYIISAYKYGSFPKIPEFVKFRQKLNNSMHYTMVTVEKMLLELMLDGNHNNMKFEELVRYMEIQPEKDEIRWNEMSDNRDLGLLISWDPEAKQLTEQDKKDSFELEKDWLKLCSLLLRSLAACAQLIPPPNDTTEGASTSNGTESPDSAETLKSLVEEFEKCLRDFDQKPLTRRKFALLGPPESRTGQYIDGKHGLVTLNMLKVTSDIQHLQVNGIDNSDDVQERIKGYLQEILDSLQGTLSKHKDSLITEFDGQKKFNRHILPQLVFLTESISYLSLLCGVCYKLLKPIKSNIAKRNRKKKGGGQPMPEVFQKFKSFLESLQKLADELHVSVLEIDPVFVSLELSKLSILDTEKFDEIDQEHETKMWQKIEQSYKQSSKELSDLLKQKIDFLNTLKL